MGGNMEKLLSKFAAAALAAVITAGSSVSYIYIEADAADAEKIIVSFDLSEEGIVVEDASVFADSEVPVNQAIFIPEDIPEKEGFYFTGWTYDDIHGYEAGDVFYPPENESVTLHPVWKTKKASKMLVLSYEVELDGELLDLTELLPAKKYQEGAIVKAAYDQFQRDGYAHYGWDFKGFTFRGGEKFIMPGEDTVLKPVWLVRRNLNYTPGDVDRIVGLTGNTVQYAETLQTSLAGSDRFTRTGFNLIGWHCDYDDKVYATLAPFIVPTQDVTLTAVWEPKNYTVVFKQTSKSADNIKIQGKTDTEITTPEATVTQEGKVLTGWKYNDKFYPVGTPFKIPGALPGMGIMLTAVWEDEIVVDPPLASVYGDSNDDGVTDISDAVLIMQYLANPEKYPISPSGLINADCVGNPDGVTPLDALAIQMLEAKTITSSDLPTTSEFLQSKQK